MVPKVRVELTRGCPRRFLRPVRLPFRHFGTTPFYRFPPGNATINQTSRKIPVPARFPAKFARPSAGLRIPPPHSGRRIGGLPADRGAAGRQPARGAAADWAGDKRWIASDEAGRRRISDGLLGRGRAALTMGLGKQYNLRQIQERKRSAETNLSAQKTPPGPGAWLPRPLGHFRRAGRAAPPAVQGTPPAQRVSAGASVPARL